MIPILSSLPSVALAVDDLALGMLFLELDLLAGQLVDVLLLRPVGLNDQSHLGPSRTSDEADDVVELLLNQVDHVAVFLLDADDLVLGLETSIPVGGHPGHDLGHNRVTIFRPQRCADSLERKVKLLIEHVLQILGTEIRRVRIECLGQAGQIDLQQFAGIDLVHLPVTVLVANLPLADSLGFVELLDDLRVEQIELDLFAQSLVRFGLVDGKLDLVGVIGQILVDGEIVLLLEQLQLDLEPLVLPRSGTARTPSWRSRYRHHESGRRDPSLLS